MYVIICYQSKESSAPTPSRELSFQLIFTVKQAELEAKNKNNSVKYLSLLLSINVLLKSSFNTNTFSIGSDLKKFFFSNVRPPVKVNSQITGALTSPAVWDTGHTSTSSIPVPLQRLPVGSCKVLKLVLADKSQPAAEGADPLSQVKPILADKNITLERNHNTKRRVCPLNTFNRVMPRPFPKTI